MKKTLIVATLLALASFAAVADDMSGAATNTTAPTDASGAATNSTGK